MLCVEDALDGLRWAESIGGLDWPDRTVGSESCRRSRAGWRGRDWVDFLAEEPQTRSCTSICLKLVAPWFIDVAARIARQRRRSGSRRCWRRKASAYDIAAYRDAPPGLRIWGGATVETADIAALLPWLDWAHDVVAAEHATAKAAE